MSAKQNNQTVMSYTDEECLEHWQYYTDVNQYEDLR